MVVLLLLAAVNITTAGYKPKYLQTHQSSNFCSAAHSTLCRLQFIRCLSINTSRLAVVSTATTLDSSSLSHSFSLASWHNHLSVRGLCLICEPYSMPCSSNNVVTIIIIILLNPGDTIHPSNAKWLVINSDLRLIFDLIVCCRIYCNSPLCNSRTLQLLCRCCCCCCPSHVFMYSFQTRRPKAMRPLLNIII